MCKVARRIHNATQKREQPKLLFLFVKCVLSRYFHFAFFFLTRGRAGVFTVVAENDVGELERDAERLDRCSQRFMCVRRWRMVHQRVPKCVN